ncbi:MAG: peptidyl-prolyl cis-trans isomerase [Pirellulaceae bacterium]
MRNLLKEPLFHFLLIGVGLFVLYAIVNREPAEESRQQITVSDGRITQLANIFAKTWQRPPTRQELQGLIDDFVLEEIYYRQAIALGINQNDTVVRRRLRQKLEFMSDEMTALLQPADAELKQYLTDHPESFRLPAIYTFEQSWFNPVKHEDAVAYVRQQLDILRSGDGPVGDPSLLPTTFEQVPRQNVDAQFGSGFAAKLDQIETGQWHGPVTSGLGLHLVRIDSRTKDHLPDLEEVRPVVEREWRNWKRIQVKQETQDRLLAEYEVFVEWPEDSAGSTDNALPPFTKGGKGGSSVSEQDKPKQP